MGVIENRIDITELERSGGGGGGGTAASVSYDNTTSHMTATDVQAALDELNIDIAANREAILDLDDDKAGTDQISNRNLLDNGWFTVNQRGKNSYTRENNAPEYTLDRWCGIQINSKAIKPKDNYGVTVDYTGVSSQKSWFCLTQLLDAKDSASLCGKSVTVSIKVSNIQNMADNEPLSVRIYDSNNKDTFPSGGLIGKLIVETEGITSDTFSVPASLTTGNLLIAIYGSTSETEYATAKFDIDAIKLEVGSVSTLDMDTIPNYAEELLKCQRYFYKVEKDNANTTSYVGIALANGNAVAGFPAFPVKMRAKPTASDYSANRFDNKAAATITSFFVDPYGVQGCIITDSMAGYGYSIAFEVSADL